eukprot:TRINITY_DN120963_c0_g1_i1.p1 TRINITY_DN120963_c0_g1~~TRINITY_DN120963_c0_g1_i1.p1  ORF type:complete len:594 (-),score=117.86 TRINITY_DN120963_c0_g1_i1:283-2013(-)
MLVLACLSALATSAGAADLIGPQATTSSGPVVGHAIPGANEFLGIPFGKPTKRYEPPEDWSGPYKREPLDATDFGAACLQVGNSAEDTYGSEDCLFANVWQPTNATPGSKLPVLVFINGGSNQFGEPEPYNGSALAVRQNVIFASIAYRTGPIGWMAFEEDHAAGRATGTYGLLDIQSGLRWVQREIANFGGDPSRVVIHGQSSGAMLVELNLIMPGSKGLFSGLVSQSGGLEAGSLQDAFAASKALGKSCGCGSMPLKACLQKAKPLCLTSATYSYGWSPCVDGVVVPEDPGSLLRKGKINPVNVMLGAQTNDTFRTMSESYMNPDGTLKPLAADQYEKSIRGMVGKRFGGRALSLYPADTHDGVQNVHRLGSFSSDQSLCGIRRRAELVNKQRPGTAFMYRFNWWYQSNKACTAEPNYHSPILGAVHEDEVTFVFGQPIFMFDGACCGKWGDRLKSEPCPQKPSCTACWNPSLGDGYHAYFDEKEWTFSEKVSGFWAAFAATGSPNGWSDAPHWPSFSNTTEVTHNIVLDADLPQQHAIERSLYNNPDICKFWDDVAAAQLAAETLEQNVAVVV